MKVLILSRKILSWKEKGSMEFGPESVYSRKFLVALAFGDRRWRGKRGLCAVTTLTASMPNVTAYPFLLSVPTMLSGSSAPAHSPGCTPGHLP